MNRKISETEIIIRDILYQRVSEVECGECTGCAFHVPGNSRSDSCTIHSSKIITNIRCGNGIWVKAQEPKEEFREIHNSLIVVNGEKYKRTHDISGMCHRCAFWDGKCKIEVQKGTNGIICGKDVWIKCEDSTTITVDPVIDPTTKKALDHMDYLHQESKKYKLNFD